jgi:DNA-binding NtrC family response regulator
MRKEVQELMAGFLPKPFTPTTLTQIVRRALAEGQSWDEGPWG